NDTSITPHSPAQGWQEVLNMWISFQCKLRGKWISFGCKLTGLVIILISAACWKLWGDPELLGTLTNEVFIILLLFTFITLIAARQSGIRLVTNAVAKAI
ncbi:hypothetical protein, partial [Shewanella atlantica]|uniref:hypothetical protein n=1 Tax=Shewanella atlantica TaxID=271099 RepID=UPI001C8C2376